MSAETGIFDHRAVARSFTAFFVSIFGTYRRYFSSVDGKQKFMKEYFIQNSPPKFRRVRSSLIVFVSSVGVLTHLSISHAELQFLEAFSVSQMFQVFIEEREARLTHGFVLDGEFERQAFIHNATYKEPQTCVLQSVCSPMLIYRCW
jgi:hypothetical protein